MIIQPETVSRRLHVPGWSIQLPVLRPPVIVSWIDTSETYENLRLQFRALKRHALDYAEKKSWNPLYWFAPRRQDMTAIYLLAKSGDLAVRVVRGETRYRISAQGRKTLDALRFARA